MGSLALVTGAYAPAQFVAGGISPLSVVAFLLLIAAGGAMLFFPDKAFVTEFKPRWLGLPFFFLGLAGLVGSLI